MVARQFADKNKFSLSGEYQASGGATIRLNAMNVPEGRWWLWPVALCSPRTVTIQWIIPWVSSPSPTKASLIRVPMSVSLWRISLCSLQRKTLLGLDAQYKFNKDFSLRRYDSAFLREIVNRKGESRRRGHQQHHVGSQHVLPQGLHVAHKSGKQNPDGQRHSTIHIQCQRRIRTADSGQAEERQREGIELCR